MTELPESIGPYRPIDRLGAGGMGEVFLARDRSGVMLAIKVMHPSMVDRPDLRERLVREVEIMRQVRGPHIAELIDARTVGDSPYVATRYIPGRSLAEVVAEDGPLGDMALAVLAHGLANALRDIHRAGCLHRDLKPGNVMLDALEPIVIDFGIAHVADATRFTRLGHATGTPTYMAPELLRFGEASRQSDVFAWGATVLFAATGHRAFWAEVTLAEIDGLLLPLRGRSPQLARLIRGSLDPDPAARPDPAVLLDQTTVLPPTAPSRLPTAHPAEPSTIPPPTAQRSAHPATEPSFTPLYRDVTDPRSQAARPPTPAPVPQPNPYHEPTAPGFVPRGAAAPPPMRRGRVGSSWAISAIACLLAGTVVAVVLYLNTRNGDSDGGSPSSSASKKPKSTNSSPTTELRFTRYADPDGLYSVLIPSTWSQTPTKDQTRDYFYGPGQNQNYRIQIEHNPTSGKTALADYQSVEPGYAARTSGYHLIKLGGTSGAPHPDQTGTRAADWEWTYTSDTGTALHVLNRGFVVNNTGWAIVIRLPAGQWPTLWPQLADVYTSFTP